MVYMLLIECITGNIGLPMLSKIHASSTLLGLREINAIGFLFYLSLLPQLEISKHFEIYS